jgi:hypothetical protein
MVTPSLLKNTAKHARAAAMILSVAPYHPESARKPERPRSRAEEKKNEIMGRFYRPISAFGQLWGRANKTPGNFFPGVVLFFFHGDGDAQGGAAPGHSESEEHHQKSACGHGVNLRVIWFVKGEPWSFFSGWQRPGE